MALITVALKLAGARAAFERRQAAKLLILALADCDDITTAQSTGDLFLACHSPYDKFTKPVIGHKTSNDEMDGYVIQFEKRHL